MDLKVVNASRVFTRKSSFTALSKTSPLSKFGAVDQNSATNGQNYSKNQRPLRMSQYIVIDEIFKWPDSGSAFIEMINKEVKIQVI